VTRVLVTGSNGLLGQKLTNLLSNNPAIELIATARGDLSQPLTRGTFEKLDVTDRQSVDKVIANHKPAFVVHTAAMTQVDDCELQQEKCWLNNVTAVENVVEACERSGSSVVHISTDFIFDGTFGPLDETAKPNPISHYGKSKLAGEEVVQKSKAPWSILRTVLVYGVNQDMSRSNIVLWVKKSLEERKVINVVNDQWRTPTLAEDLATACLLAIQKSAKGIYHVSGDEIMTPLDIARRTATFFKLDNSLINATDSTRFTQPARRPPKTGFIIEKAKRELGFKPHSFQQGLEIVRLQMKGKA
jgi:dTDP-4-dehydrorhamnose reductase